MKNNRPLPPRDAELQDGFLRREIIIKLTLHGDLSIEISESESWGQLSLSACISRVLERFNSAIQNCVLAPATNPEDADWVNLTLGYYEMEDTEAMVGTNHEVSVGDFLTEANRNSICDQLARRATPRFQTELESLEVTLL
jgi:hypothetical protein